MVVPKLTIERDPFKVIAVDSFRGGLNTFKSPEKLRFEELREATNVVYTQAGIWEKRPGLANVTPSPYDSNPVKSLFYFDRWSGSALASLALNASGTTLRLEAGTALISTLASPSISGDVMNNLFYFGDGTNYFQSDGTAAGTVAISLPTDEGATLTEIKRCSVFRQFRGRMYATGDPQNPRTVYYSQIDRPDYFKAGGTPDYRINEMASGGYPNTFIEPFKGFLTIGNKEEIWGLYGDPVAKTRELAKVMVDEGPINGRTVARCGNYLMFAGRNNVYGINTLDKDNPSSIEMGDGISLYIRAIYHRENAVCVGFDGCFYLACQLGSSGAVNDTVFVFDTRIKMPSTTDDPEVRYGAWSKWTGMAVASWHVIEGVLHYGDAGNGFIRKFVPGQLNDFTTTAISSKVRLAPLKLNTPNDELKFVRRLFVWSPQLTVTNTMKIKATIDYRYREFTVNFNESFVWGLSKWGESRWGWTDTVKKELDIMMFGNRLDIEVSDDTLNCQMSLYGFGVERMALIAQGSRVGVTKL